MKGNRIDGRKCRGITGLRMGRDSHSVTGLSGAVHGACQAGWFCRIKAVISHFV